MQYIDEKFKDEKPEITGKKIIKKLDSIGVTLSERWNDSKIENCQSLRVTANGGEPGTNGKGVTKVFARASAYGEFIERLQTGLFFYKYQSFENDESVFLHSFAPDKRYLTKEELLQEGDWMEPIAKRYGITKEHIADQCQIYACGDKILTLPFYSLFEDRYVYLPAAFIEHIYGSNGCCVGNTKEEAWVHALSEILERHSNIEILKSGKSAPIIPREKLKKFKTVDKILTQIEEKGFYDVEVFDYSYGKNFPVIATRIINKKTKNYIVNCGADPVFEIAVERTLTEIFQGRNIENFTSRNGGVILNKLSDIKTIDNVTNHIETGNGLYTADYFADDAGETNIDLFGDNSQKSNLELLAEVIGKFKQMNLPVLVRNYSFLGFPCYLFIVPGFSEAKGDSLKELIPTYYFADRAAKTLRNIKKADIAQLTELLMYHKMIANFISRKNNFGYLSGLPLSNMKLNIASIHFAYAAKKINNYDSFNRYIDLAINCTPDDDTDKDYLMLVKQWETFMHNGIDKEKALKVIEKFFFENSVKRFKANLETNTLLDDFLVSCEDCNVCKFKDDCCYDGIRNIIEKTGKEYSRFVNGQDKANFLF